MKQMLHLADSKISERDRDLWTKLGAKFGAPQSEFERELCILYAAAIEYARNNGWPPGEAAIRALERTGISESRTPEEYAEKQRALLVSAPDGDPRYDDPKHRSSHSISAVALAFRCAAKRQPERSTVDILRREFAWLAPNRHLIVRFSRALSLTTDRGCARAHERQAEDKTSA